MSDDPGASRLGLALAGGGPEGAVWEIGALRALDEALEGFDLNAMHVYVGVSAGSFVAACLANRITSDELCRAIVYGDAKNQPFVPEAFLSPALDEWLRRGLSLPRLILDATASYLQNPADQSLLESLTRMTRALPVGLLDNEPVRTYLERILTTQGRTDDFRELDTRLAVVATDLDSGRAVRFGEPGFDHVPISHAVQASTALPGMYPPVEIDGRSYVDGVLLKTLHASVALEAGAELLIGLNPIVPVDTQDAIAAGVMRRGKLVHRGLPTVLSQTFRTLVHSRLAIGISAYRKRFPHADVVLLEPGRDDYRMFFTNIFRLSSRRSVCEHAYRSVRRQLLDRSAELEPVFARHGVKLRRDVLRDEDREVWDGVGRTREPDGAEISDRLGRALGRLERVITDAEKAESGDPEIRGAGA